ncbi:MAG: hypothetical protein V1846_05405 [Candidatus Komeilibacteria bacterium]
MPNPLRILKKNWWRRNPFCKWYARFGTNGLTPITLVREDPLPGAAPLVGTTLYFGGNNRTQQVIVIPLATVNAQEPRGVYIGFNHDDSPECSRFLHKPLVRHNEVALRVTKGMTTIFITDYALRPYVPPCYPLSLKEARQRKIRVL